MNKKYIVMELQTNVDGTVGNIVTSHDTLDEAYSKYHYILAAAAVSTLPSHAAVLLNGDGDMVNHYCFRHVQPSPEPSPEES